MDYFTCLDYVYKDSWKDLCKRNLTLIAFMVRKMALNHIFSIFQLVEIIKLTVYLNICHWMSKQAFCRTEILLFLLIPRFGCFVVIYVSRSMRLHSYPWESYRCIRVQNILKRFLKFKSLSKIFLKAINDLLTLPKNKKHKNERYTLVLMISGKSVLADSINNIFQLPQSTIT